MSNYKGLFKVNFDVSGIDVEKKDGIISIIFYFYVLAAMYLFGLFMFKTNIYKTYASYFNNKYFYKDIFYIPFTLIVTIPIFMLLKMRHQSIKSIGLKSDKIIKSILLGIIFSLPFTSQSIIYAISQQKKVISLINMLWIFLYYFIEIAFVEELIYRGHLQTRIQGLIKEKWISIVVVGIMFGLSHVPFQMLANNMSFIDFILKDYGHLVTTCFIHIYLVYLYTRDNNILSTTVTHTLIDFIPGIFI